MSCRGTIDSPEAVDPDYTAEEQLSAETNGDAEQLPAEEMPKIGFMVGSNPDNVLGVDA